jgi:RimJ/RimL family protein N-acetyltransferase
MRPSYLTGRLIFLRALTREDAKHSAAWFPAPFPIDPGQADSYLKETHANIWDRKRRLVMARREDDSIAGSVEVHTNRAHAIVTFMLAPTATDGDDVQADAIRILAGWLRDEAEHVTVDFSIASDQPASIAAAEEVGLVASARFREAIWRGGHRVDRLTYQALNPHLLGRETVNA